MCGIFGVIADKKSGFTAELLKETTDHLFRLSESRGKEATGAAFFSDGKTTVYKQPLAASVMVKSVQYRDLFYRAVSKKPLAIIGHSRLVTNGRQELEMNNQPVVTEKIIGVHNGIIVNNDDLWDRFPEIKRKYEVDTEILLRLIQMFIEKGDSPAGATRKAFEIIEGSASVALLLEKTEQLILATNTGSLYTCRTNTGDALLFASERYIINTLLCNRALKSVLKDFTITQLKPGTGCSVEISDLKVSGFDFKISDHSLQKKVIISTTGTGSERWLNSGIGELKRCSRCILPETMPFIEYDKDGVCNYCRNYQKIQPKGEEALKEFVNRYRKNSGEPDCLVAFSGGRDSSYGLHYIKTVLKMQPLAFTYDWGMVTDLARRNQARICGRLGIEHILVSADINQKRANIRKNIEAWLKKPDLGMVPLFMAGDKQFYYYAHKLRKQNNISLFIFCGGNEFERTDFKLGFCGIPGGSGKGILTNLSLINKIKLAAHYGWQYISNPAYMNSSLADTLFAFYSSYLMHDDYLYLYHYIDWDEKKIITTLREEYNWETAQDTKGTWRIGDGTAPFYNYIYYAVAGFTEHDTFRSNQVREGIITREKALELAKEDNEVRHESLRWYAERIGFDLEKALNIIDSIPKLYKKA